MKEKGRPVRCGDWLLLPEDAAPPVGGRLEDGRWRRAFRGSGRTLWWSDPSRGWIGTPCRRVGDDADREQIWLLGESPVSDDELRQLVRDLEGSRLDPSLRLGGRFLLLVHRRDDRSWELLTDRFGTLHAYATTDGRAVGTSFRAVSESSSRRLDWLGLSTFFALGFFLDERTHYDDVRCLGPARRHRLGARGVDGERYWRWWHRPETDRGTEETTHCFAELFEQVVAEASGGRTVLPLSGGLDSRALAAALPDGADVRSFSYGYQPDSVEIRLAGRLASRRGLPFEAKVVEPYLEHAVDLALGTVEGFQDITQSRQLGLADTLSDWGDSLLAGHWGDVWLDDMGFRGLGEESLPTKLFTKMAKNGRGWLLEHLCGSKLEAEGSVESAVEAELARNLEAYDHLEEPDFRVKAFKTDHWSCRWTLASVRAYQAAIFPRLPFYDPRLADFFATVPTDRLVDRRLEIDYLKLRAPDLARVPWQETGADLFTPRRRAHWRGLPRRAVAKAWRTVRRRGVIERNWEVQWLSPGGRRRLEDLVLRPGLRLHDLVAPAAVRRLLDDFYARPDAGAGYTVSMLATFAAFLERA